MPSTQPALPEPAHQAVDSMLTRKFGKEVTNYFAGSPLNRVGFLRGDHTFLSKALAHPSTSFLLCNELQPLVKPDTQPGRGRLHWVKYEDVRPVIGDDPYAKTEADILKAYDSDLYIPQMIFLGIDEKNQDGLEYKGKNVYKGAPYFAVDVTPNHDSIKSACEKLIADQAGKGFEFHRGRVMDIDAQDGKYPSPVFLYDCRTDARDSCNLRRSTAAP